MPAARRTSIPSKPVKIIVPYAPGGATDIVARILGEQMRQILGQSFVVENKPGAFGILAIEEMARSKPDGYTLMIGNVTTNAITPVIVPKKFSINYDKDVVPVTRLVDIPAFLIVTTTNFDVEDRQGADRLRQEESRQGALRHVGVGSYPHYDMAFFAKRAGDLDMIAIHNKAGASGMINDMVTGDTQASFLNVASTAPMIKAGKLKPIALVNHARLPEYPGRADDGGGRLPRRRHARLAGPVRAGRHAQGGAGDAVQGRRARRCRRRPRRRRSPSRTSTSCRTSRSTTPRPGSRAR